MALSITTLSITTLSIMTLSIAALSIMMFSIKNQIQSIMLCAGYFSLHTITFKWLQS